MSKRRTPLTVPYEPSGQALLFPVDDRNAQDLSARLVAFLESRNGWHSAKYLRTVLFLAPRLVRLARQHSDGRVIFGQKGFKALKFATADEIKACTANLRSRANAMLHEAAQVTRRSHSQLGRSG